MFKANLNAWPMVINNQKLTLSSGSIKVKLLVEYSYEEGIKSLYNWSRSPGHMPKIVTMQIYVYGKNLKNPFLRKQSPQISIKVCLKHEDSRSKLCYID